VEDDLIDALATSVVLPQLRRVAVGGPHERLDPLRYQEAEF
jgi:hypothetical protein